MTQMKSIVILLVSLAFSGCAIMRPTDPYPSVNMPSQASSARTLAVSHAKVPEGTMTLQQAIEIGLANNPEIAALGSDATAAEARQDQAFSARLPRLSVVGDYTYHLDEQRLLPVGQPGDPTILSRDIFSGDVVLSLPLFTGGRLINQVKAADLIQQAAAHRLSRSREDLVFNVSSVFFSILAQQHVIESLEFSLRTLEEHGKRIDALIVAQKAAKVDRMRTEVRLADVQQQLVREKNLMTIQRRILANFLGLEGHIDQIALQGELEVEGKSIVPEFEASLAVAWEERDDYLAARATLDAQARNVDVARAGHWPTVSLQGSYGGRWASGPTSGTGDDFGDVGRIGFALEIPLFEGGRVDAKVREQHAVLVAAQERLRKFELQIRLEVETALSNIRSSEERLEAMWKSIALARESLRIEQQKYDLGKGAIVDVLDAQAALLESETTYYRVLSEFHTALAQLKFAIGEE
jgi:outer membrane protein